MGSGDTAIVVTQRNTRVTRIGSISNISNDYASVLEQSGIRASDGAIDVKIKGNTHPNAKVT